MNDVVAALHTSVAHLRTIVDGLGPDQLRRPAYPSGPDSEADLTIPAEAFLRLVYGRLDPDHTPAGVGGRAVDQLRQVFPGV